MKVNTQDLSKSLEGYSNKWIALKPNTSKVVASGSSLRSVIKKARESGVSDPVVTRAPKDYGVYVL